MKNWVNRLNLVLARIGIFLLRAYRCGISPWLGPHCRFFPTCSHYAEQALREHGPFIGSWLALRRLLRCHPGTRPGADPVPSNHRGGK